MRYLACSVMMALVIAVLAGCAGIQAKQATAGQMDLYAAAVNPLACGHVTDVAVCRAFLSPEGADLQGTGCKFSATVLTAWYAQATTNVFSYGFGSATIFCDAKYYPILQRVAAGAAESSNVYASCSDAAALVRAQRLALDIQDIDAMMSGVVPPAVGAQPPEAAVAKPVKSG